jgi:SAM-dependent methyltransferase
MSSTLRQPFSLKQRSHEQEWLDRNDTDPKELAAVLRDLARFNTAFLGHLPILRWLSGALKPTTAGSIPTILDVGCGYGDLLRAIRKWSRKQGLNLTLIGVDLNPQTIRVAQDATDQADDIHFEVMDVFKMPLDRTFDFIVSSLVAHHFSDETLRDFLSLMERHSDQAWLIYDLQRHRFLHEFLGLAGWLARLHPMVVKDGQISVRRALSRIEWMDQISAAGFEHSDIDIRWFLFRYVIARRKVRPSPAGLVRDRRRAF